MAISRRKLLKISVGAGAFALDGPSMAQDSFNLRLQLGWIANVEYAGVRLALKRGYFRQSKINLQYAAGGPNSPPSPVVVASGNADGGYVNWLPFIDAVGRGNDFVMIGATFPVSPLGIISLVNRPIRAPAGDRGDHLVLPGLLFTSAGLRALPPGSDDLFRALGASRMTTLSRLALPSAVPSLMISFRLAAAHTVLAAMVAEFLMGTSGLGNLFHAAKDEFNMERALGASAIATVVSAIGFLVAAAAERRMNERWS